MHKVLDGEMVKPEMQPRSPVAKRGNVAKKVTRQEIFRHVLFKLKASFLWHIMREK